MDLSTHTSMPAIVLVMTPFPYSVEMDDPLSRAEDMMKIHGVHHLPVQRNGKLVGILSNHEVERYRHAHAEPRDVANEFVRDCRVGEAYTVDRSHPLDAVLGEMVKRHLDSVLVTKRDKLVGIFSSSDACQCLADVLKSKFPPDEGDAA
jgi:acetoin utilization protein AcuB